VGESCASIGSFEPQRNGDVAGLQDDFVESGLGLGSVALENRAAFAILARFQEAMT
jgi:hypothetical protein